MNTLTKTLTALGLVMCLNTPFSAHAEEEFIGPPGVEGEAASDPGAAPEFDFEKIRDMSPEERKEHRKAMREKIESMSPEEREAFKAKMRERFESLPPEEQERIKAMRAEHKGKHGGKHGGMRMLSPEDIDAMQNMTPEERKAYVQKKRESFKNMSEEERAAFREKKKAEFENMSEEDRAAMKEKRKAFFDSLSDEERQALMKHRGKHGGKHGGKGGHKGDGQRPQPVPPEAE